MDKIIVRMRGDSVTTAAAAQAQGAAQAAMGAAAEAVPAAERAAGSASAAADSAAEAADKLAKSANLSDLTDFAAAWFHLGLKALAAKDKVNNTDWQGEVLSLANGGTGAGDLAGALANLQLNSATLSSFKALLGAANRMPYWSAPGVMEDTALTAAARGLLDDTTVAAMLTTLGAAPAVRAQRGGTANAITLTSPVALAAGAEVRFRANAANTGAATIALNGGAAIACQTITGAVLPAGYIRTDVDTVARYDGSVWVLGREEERGENANGYYVRFASGIQICWTVELTSDVTTAQGAGFSSSNVSFTWPSQFAASPVVSTSVNDVRVLVSCNSSGLTTGTLTMKSFISITSRACTIDGQGRWY